MWQATIVARQEVALRQLHCNWLISFLKSFSLLAFSLCVAFASFFSFLIFYCFFICFYFHIYFYFYKYISLELLSHKSLEIVVCKIVRAFQSSQLVFRNFQCITTSSSRVSLLFLFFRLLLNQHWQLVFLSPLRLSSWIFVNQSHFQLQQLTKPCELLRLYMHTCMVCSH